MWPRTVELMFGVWLAVSPFVFGHPWNDSFLWWNDLTCGTLVVAFSAASFSSRLGWAHLLTLVVGLWLAGGSYFLSSYPTPPAFQNELLVGLLLVMFAVVPNEANEPPLAWREPAD